MSMTLTHGNKRTRVPRFVQDITFQDPLINRTQSNQSEQILDEVIDPLVERRNDVLFDAVTVDDDTDLRLFVRNRCSQAT